MVSSALKQVGVKEEGTNDGKMVREYLLSTHLGPNFAWCAAFCHWNYRQCGKVLEPARDFAAAAKFGSDHIVFKKGQLEMYNDSRLGHPFQRISDDGDVFTLFYTKLGRIGHVGIITGEDEDYLLTAEGNTGSGGEREGDGVYRRKRLKASVFTVNRW